MDEFQAVMRDAAESAQLVADICARMEPAPSEVEVWETAIRANRDRAETVLDTLAWLAAEVDRTGTLPVIPDNGER